MKRSISNRDDRESDKKRHDKKKASILGKRKSSTTPDSPGRSQQNATKNILQNPQSSQPSVARVPTNVSSTAIAPGMGTQRIGIDIQELTSHPLVTEHQQQGSAPAAGLHSQAQDIAVARILELRNMMQQQDPASSSSSALPSTGAQVTSLQVPTTSWLQNALAGNATNLATPNPGSLSLLLANVAQPASPVLPVAQLQQLTSAPLQALLQQGLQAQHIIDGANRQLQQASLVNAGLLLGGAQSNVLTSNAALGIPLSNLIAQQGILSGNALVGLQQALQGNPQAATAAAGDSRGAPEGNTSATFQDADANANANKPLNKTETDLYLPMDHVHLSEYQILVRKQIVVCEADELEIKANTQGRRSPLSIGQAGIRCRHCKHKPFRLRGRGSVYYPTSLHGLYQTCQNMANTHLRKTCTSIDEDLRQQLIELCGMREKASGGKQYWSDGGKALGLYEEGGALRWRHEEEE
mmetsp:Transcript_11787/g.18270  ORF Transcript_11787/g.18270 Transcript_11787/m.18270 type:complete len:468 (+) Transcript_11787:96-1499(+)|eukprot:CAMPEP_0195304458 /NCGR_PEP_ID=MMETSP0707-20130614/34479_1 /TAXON_ID=33640 /ORGANISM="Asterionellopsis glacialis, Strain CCMP134" /LENGTH=467 /DNA_ID=CAMNT_0040368263 /DNA_START=72 /DNA_END=1475 /DNA_ORIENTATION=-